MQNNNEHINDKIKTYIDGNLSNEELHNFEKEMLEDEMMNDAVEGLSSIKNKGSIDVLVNDLNKQLKNYTASKKQRREKRRLELNSNTIIAIVLIISLCVLCYYFVSKHV